MIKALRNREARTSFFAVTEPKRSMLATEDRTIVVKFFRNSLNVKILATEIRIIVV